MQGVGLKNTNCHAAQKLAAYSCQFILFTQQATSLPSIYHIEIHLSDFFVQIAFTLAHTTRDNRKKRKGHTPRLDEVNCRLL
jgi:hypothetical protein